MLEQLGWLFTSVQAIGWYTVMSSSQRMELIWQQLSVEKAQHQCTVVSSSQRTILLAVLFLDRQLGCYASVKLSQCKQPGMFFFFFFFKYKQVNSLL